MGGFTQPMFIWEHLETQISTKQILKSLENNIFEVYILYLKDRLEHFTFLKVTVWQKICNLYENTSYFKLKLTLVKFLLTEQRSD